MDRFQFSLLGLSAEEERMRLVSTSASESTSLTRLVRECAARMSLLVCCILISRKHVWHAVRRGACGLPRVSCCPVLGRSTARLVSPSPPCVLLALAMQSTYYILS